MALTESPFKVMHRGEWPGPITFRRGWARADARPWNDTVKSASLRLVRGGGGFLQACTDRLCTVGAPTVLSPPLPASAHGPWLEADYEHFLDLALMRLELTEQPHCPNHLVVDGSEIALSYLLDIDAAAFKPFWRFDEHGMTEALEATGNSDTLIIRDAHGGAAGFAIVGYGSAVAYLQRVAVHPQWQGQGMGRSLVRAAARKARKNGAKIMLLNTQYDNEQAIGLYEDEGFSQLPEPLTLLRFDA
jgi:GNAT superfamily N-acetyltransferase